MANVTQRIDYKIKATDEATATFTKLGKGMEGLEESAKGLRHTLGEERPLAALLKGGIIGFAGEKLGEMTEKAVELRDKFEEGKLSAAGLVSEISKGIPIVGGFVTAGQGIRELLTGEAAEIKAINEDAERTNKIIEARETLIKNTTKAIAEFNSKAASVAFETATMGMGQADRTNAMRSKTAATAEAEAQAELASKLAGLEAQSKADMARLNQATDAARQQLAKEQQDTTMSKVMSLDAPDPQKLAGAQAAVNAAVDAEKKALDDLDTKRKAIAAAAEGNLRELHKRTIVEQDRDNAELTDRLREMDRERYAALDRLNGDFYKADLSDFQAGLAEKLKSAQAISEAAAGIQKKTNATLLETFKKEHISEMLAAQQKVVEQRNAEIDKATEDYFGGGGQSRSRTQSPVATLASGSSFLVGNSSSDAEQQVTKTAQNTEKSARLSASIDRTLGLMLSELRRQNRSNPSGGLQVAN